LRRTFFSISAGLGMHRLFALLNRNRPIVLAFHGVTAEKPGHLCNYQGKHLHLPIFTRLMEYLAKRYNPVPLGSVVDWLEKDVHLPERAVAVTFDDGYRNVLTNAAPVLERLGIPATLFVVTDFVYNKQMLWPDRLISALSLTQKESLRVETKTGAKEMSLGSQSKRIDADRCLRSRAKALPDLERVNMLDAVIGQCGVEESRLAGAWPDHEPLEPEELRQLPAMGIEVGSHTCSHGIVSHYPPEQQRRELDRSRSAIEETLGKPCAEFSYPNGAVGDFDAGTRNQVIAAGYRCAVTTVQQRVQAGVDRYEIPRYILTHNDIGVNEFGAGVSGYQSFLKNTRDQVTGRR